MEEGKNYLISFIVGGLTVAGIKYASNNLSQEYAGIIGALPIGLFSVLFIIKNENAEEYIKNYTIQTIVTILAGFAFMLYLYLNKKNKVEISKEVKIAYVIAILVWIVGSFAKFKLGNY